MWEEKDRLAPYARPASTAFVSESRRCRIASRASPVHHAGRMKHNSYFDGKVQSLGLNTMEGYATVGVIEPGRYNFKTDAEERMQVVAGNLKAKLPGGSWQSYAPGQAFVVPPKAAFDVEAAADVAYLCSYRK